MDKTKYDFLNDVFTTYENVEPPKVYLNMPLFNEPLDVSDWVENTITQEKPDGTVEEVPIVKNLLTVDNTPEVPIVKYTGQTNPQLKQLPITEATQKAMKYFMDKGLEKHQAAGLVGNLIRESKLNITAENPNGGAFGLAQWNGPRRSNLFKKYGKQPTFEQQLDYIWQELNTTHKNGLNKLKHSKTAEEAAINAFGYYEFSVGPQGAIQDMINHNQDGWKSYYDGINFAKQLMI